jgi:hypothetical protein
MEDLDILENSLDFVDSETEQPTPLLAKKEPKKRKPTPKQLEVLEKAREKMIMNAREKKIKKQLEDEAIEKEVQRRLNEYKKGVEEKIVRKAIAIKKKEIMKQAVLDEIEDDDTPMEKVVQKAKKQQPSRPDWNEPKKNLEAPSASPISSPLVPPTKKYIYL